MIAVGDCDECHRCFRLARRVKHPRRSRGVEQQRADVGDRSRPSSSSSSYPRDQRHLRAVEVLRMPAANPAGSCSAGGEVPVAHVASRGDLVDPDALALVAVAVGAGAYSLRPRPRSASPCSVGRRRVVGQRRDVRDDVCDRCVVVEHRGERHHLLADGVVRARRARPCLKL